MYYNDIKISGSDTGGPLTIKNRVDVIRDFTSLNNKSILDCGCGCGDYVLELFKFSDEVYGVEYSEEKVNKYKSLGVKPDNVRQGDIQFLDYENESFDLILLNEVLEHIPNQEKALNEIFRILKQDGILVIFSPNRFYPFETHSVKVKLLNLKLPIHFPFVPYIPLRAGNKLFTYFARNYFPQELKNLVEKSGFKILNHCFIVQQFEGLGGHNNFFYKSTRSIFRSLFNIINKIPILRSFFSVSQVVFASKPKKTGS